MLKLARVGDMHSGTCNHNYKCCPHKVKGVISSGSPNVYINSRKQARDKDLVTHNCPHCGTGFIVSTGNLKINGLSAAKIGDRVIYPGGTGFIKSGSEDTLKEK